VPGFISGDFQLQEANEIGAPYVEIAIPAVMGIMTALVLSIVIGLGSTWGPAKIISGMILELRDIVNKVIQKFIIPLLPLFIACVFAGIAAKGELFSTISVFGQMLILIIVLQFIWLLIEYIVAGAISRNNPATMAKAMLPAYFTAMGTMSSAISMTVSLKQAKTVPYMNKKIADFVMPVCANAHLSGAAMAITTSAITVTLLTQGELPPVGLIISFIIILGVIEVGAVGVPGGSALAAIGILQSTLGFDETAIGLMLALFMIQDSFGTATNIAGDGAIAMIINRFFGEKEVVDVETVGKGLEQ